jgi:predicted transcriptional regulator
MYYQKGLLMKNKENMFCNASVRIEQNEYNKLAVIAKKTKRPISGVIAIAVSDFLKTEKAADIVNGKIGDVI